MPARKTGSGSSRGRGEREPSAEPVKNRQKFSSATFDVLVYWCMLTTAVVQTHIPVVSRARRHAIEAPLRKRHLVKWSAYDGVSGGGVQRIQHSRQENPTSEDSQHAQSTALLLEKLSTTWHLFLCHLHMLPGDLSCSMFPVEVESPLWGCCAQTSLARLNPQCGRV